MTQVSLWAAATIPSAVAWLPLKRRHSHPCDLRRDPARWRPDGGYSPRGWRLFWCRSLKCGRRCSGCRDISERAGECFSAADLRPDVTGPPKLAYYEHAEDAAADSWHRTYVHAEEPVCFVIDWQLEGVFFWTRCWRLEAGGSGLLVTPAMAAVGRVSSSSHSSMAVQSWRQLPDLPPVCSSPVPSLPACLSPHGSSRGRTTTEPTKVAEPCGQTNTLRNDQVSFRFSPARS